MTALISGKKAPDFKLPLLQGGTFSLQEALGRGPVLLAFFKVGCPTCQYAFPFLERLYKAHQNTTVTVVGVSQDKAENTEVFNQKFGITFPVALDEAGYPASNAYGLTNVPTIFLIAPSGTIEVSCVGWSREDLDEVYRRLRQVNSSVPTALWHNNESVLAFKAG